VLKFNIFTFPSNPIFQIINGAVGNLFEYMEHRVLLNYILGKSPVTPQRRPHSVSTAFQKVADRRGARSAVASNALETLWNRCEYAVQSRRTSNAAACVHNVLDSMLWGRCGNAVWSSRAPWARCGRVACTP